MDEEEDKGRTDIEKKKILAIFPNDQELQGDIYNVKLLSSDREGLDWQGIWLLLLIIKLKQNI